MGKSAGALRKRGDLTRGGYPEQGCIERVVSPGGDTWDTWDTWETQAWNRRGTRVEHHGTGVGQAWNNVGHAWNRRLTYIPFIIYIIQYYYTYCIV